jgi:uncharacterized protein (TIGR02246 family)
VDKVQDTEPLRVVLDQWRAAIDAHQPHEVAELFTEDAIFQGLRPYSVGRRGVEQYYSSQSPGMTVDYRIRESRTLTTDLVLGYVAADFRFPHGPTIAIHLGVLIRNGSDGWRIAYYQASRAEPPVTASDATEGN